MPAAQSLSTLGQHMRWGRLNWLLRDRDDTHGRARDGRSYLSPRRATIKALPATPRLPRPYGSRSHYGSRISPRRMKRRLRRGMAFLAIVGMIGGLLF